MILNDLGIESVLEAGHGGIFEITLDGKIVATNAGQCACIPTAEEIVQALHQAMSGQPGTSQASNGWRMTPKFGC